MKSRKYNINFKTTKHKYLRKKKTKQKYDKKKTNKRKHYGGKNRWCCSPSRWIIKSRKHIYEKAKQGNKGNNGNNGNNRNNRRNSMGLNNYSTNNRSRSSKPDANCPTFKELRKKSEDESLRREWEPIKWDRVKKTKKELKEELGEQGYKKVKERIAKEKAKYYKRQRQQQYKDMTTLPEWFR